MKAVKRPSGVIIVGEKTIPFVFEKSKLEKVVFLKRTAYLCFSGNRFQHIKKGND